MGFFFHIGRYFSMLKLVLAKPEKHKMYFKQLIYEIENLGVNSVGIVVIISVFLSLAGTVFTLTMYTLVYRAAAGLAELNAQPAVR